MSNLSNEIGSAQDSAVATRDVVTCPSCRTRWRVPEGAATSLRCRCSRCEQVFSAGDAKTPYRVRLAGAGSGAGEPDGANDMFAPVDVPGESRTRDLRVGMDDPSLADHLGRTALDGGADRKAWTWTVVADPEPPPAGVPETSDVEDPAPVVAVGCEAEIVETDGVATAFDDDVEPGDEQPAERSAEQAELALDEFPSGPASLRESPLEPLIEAIDRSREPEPAGAPETAETAAVDEVAEVVQDDDVAADARSTAPEPVSVPDRTGRPGVGTVLIVVLLGAAFALAAWTWTPWLTAAVADALAWWPVPAGPEVPADPRSWAGLGAAFGLLVGWGWLRWTLRRR